MGPLWRDIRGATKLRALTMHSGEGGAPRQQLGARGPAAGWHFRKARVGVCGRAWKAGPDPSDRSICNRGFGLSRGVCSWGALSHQSPDRIQPLVLAQAESKRTKRPGAAVGVRDGEQACLRSSSSLAAPNPGSLCFLFFLSCWS